MKIRELIEQLREAEAILGPEVDVTGFAIVDTPDLPAAALYYAEIALEVNQEGELASINLLKPTIQAKMKGVRFHDFRRLETPTGGGEQDGPSGGDSSDSGTD